MIINSKVKDNELYELLSEADTIYSNPESKFKVRGTGLFAKPSKRIQEICSCFLNDIDESLNWDIELYKSTKPTGLHNDVNYDQYTNTICKKVMLLPLKWMHGMSPSTIVFNERYSEKKVFEGITKGTFIDAATKQAIESPLSLDFLLEDEFYEKWLGHCMKSSMTGLSVKSVEMWESGKAMIFDSDLLHASGNFDWKNGEWKICVLALGYEKNSVKESI